MVEQDRTIAVAIATAGRREMLSETLAWLAKQTRAADEVLICGADPGDVDESRVAELFPDAVLVRADRGLTRQRNALLREVQSEVVVYFDDDFLPARDYLAEVSVLFADPDIVMSTGLVLEDGISGAGLSYDAGVEVLLSAGPTEPSLADVHNAYGCNMAVRRQTALQFGVEFDEALPLYGWLEDVDFSRRMREFGRVVKSSSTRGVHLGTKSSGRSPGIRLGYSQVINPIYLARKGTLSWSRASTSVGRNLLANMAKWLFPEPWVDRRGRLHGNLLGVFDLARARLNPGRAADF